MVLGGSAQAGLGLQAVAAPHVGDHCHLRGWCILLEVVGGLVRLSSNLCGISPGALGALTQRHVQVLFDSDGLSSFRTHARRRVHSARQQPRRRGRNWLAIALALARPRFRWGFAVGFLGRQERLVVEPLWCASHSSWRDFQRVLKATNLWTYWLLLLITMNVAHGPWSEDARYAAVRQAWSELRQFFVPNICPLFDEWASNMVWEQGLSSQLTGTQTAELWECLSSETPMSLKDYKVNMHRFWHGVEKAKQYAVHWSSFLLGCSYLGLERDILHSASVRKVLFPATATSEATASTSSAIPGADDKALHQTCTNFVALAVLFLYDRSRLATLRCILCACRPVEAWYRHQVAQCRSADDNSAWFVDQVSGGYFSHVVEVMRVLCHEKDQEWCGFLHCLASNGGRRAGVVGRVAV